MELHPLYANIQDGRNGISIPGDLCVKGTICNNKWITREPFLDENTANVANKPTHVVRGLFRGYSLPEYAPGEELFFRMRVPFGWDQVTNPAIAFISSTSSGETLGDKYKFSLEWASGDVGGVIPIGITEILYDEVTIVDSAAFYANIIQFNLDGTHLAGGQNLQMRLRRVAPTAPSVSAEIIVWHWTSRWKKNKVGTDSPTGY